ncbi:ExbD/TolR family protein [Rickettsia endosymbiont of Cardiosporidium cionae]|uniref:ExbD/TolR family protein n=1 Tax=Rickettsia endosymbiont of Cardiosporidium cionae TaxID=2777155 RepID=UPI001E41BB43|nr:ExbD/TolR family protein [Rickettsia endosymbiont of Cardiosporidium cionae]KAF8818411.1 protein TolR [Rickettsia endosymbiont of Cardiosporidium cionae]
MRYYNRTSLKKYISNNKKPIYQINVTPVIDVMLVLLVVFMLTAKSLLNGVDVNLPKNNAKSIENYDTPIVLTINKEGKIYIFEQEIAKNDLKKKLSNILKEKQDDRIFIRGDQNLSYGFISNIMVEIYNAGFTKLSMISETQN